MRPHQLKFGDFRPVIGLINYEKRNRNAGNLHQADYMYYLEGAHYISLPLSPANLQTSLRYRALQFYNYGILPLASAGLLLEGIRTIEKLLN